MSVTAEPTHAPSIPDAEIPDVPIYRLSVAQYHAMAKVGIFDEGARVELLEGWLVPKVSQNPPHVLVSGLLLEMLVGLISGSWHLRIGNPVTTTDSEPEPDVAVVRGARRDFGSRHPGPEDTALVIEVADTSLRTDRGRKKRLYARAGIPVYWIVNLNERRIEVYTDPTGPADAPDYRTRRDYYGDQSVPVLLDGTEVGQVPVAELLP